MPLPRCISLLANLKLAFYICFMASQMAQMVRNLPAIHETQVRSLGQEDPLKKGNTIHSSVLA